MMIVKFKRLLCAASLLVTTNAAWQVEASEPAQPATPNAAGYFTSETVEQARFAQDATGRTYAVAGNLFFAFGGLRDGVPSSSVEVLEKSPTGYLTHHAELATPVAFAGATNHNGTIYLVGGLTPDGVSAQVLALTWQNGQLNQQRLPDLPVPVMLAGVAIHRSTTKNYLYVLSGIDSPQATSALASMFEMRLEDIGTDRAQWAQKEDLPGGGRLGAIVKETYNEIVISGGWTLNTDGTLQVSPETWGYARIARDGHAEAGWEQRANMPQPVAHSAFSKTGQGHITVIGGDTADSTLSALLSGTPPQAPTSDSWAFHDPTDTWNRLGNGALPTAGGLLAKLDNDDYLLLDTQSADGTRQPGTKFSFARTVKPMKGIDYAIIAAYFLMVAGVGTWFARKQTTSEEFALGNRKVKWWAAGISMFASGVSTISFMALPALIACIGLATTGSVVFMLVGIFVGAYVTYPMLRRLNITSTYEYLEQRYGLPLRLIGSFVGIVTQLMGRIGIVVMLPALAISAMTGMEPWKAILLTGIVTTLYSTAGGFEAVVWTDVVQGVLMMFGFIAMGVLAFMNIDGGWSTFVEYGRDLNRLNFFIGKFDLTVNMVWFAIAGHIIGIMAFASDQATAQRVLSTPMKDVRKLAFMGGAFSIGSALVVAATGMGLFAFFKSNPGLLVPVMKNDQMVPLFILNQVPVGLSGLLIATMFAAAMSTVSTSVNSCAVMFGEDFYKRFRKSASSKEEMRVMQVVSMLTGTVGTALALILLSMPMPTLWETFTRIMALIGGGFVGVYSLGMFTRRTHELGAIIGVTVSFFVAFFIQYLPWDIHYGGLGLITVLSCLVSGYVASILIPWRRKPLKGLTVWDMISDEEAQARLTISEQD